MKGMLIVNHFLKSAKFDEIHEWICVAAKKQNVALEQCTNAEVINRLLKCQDWFTDANTKPDFVIFWDKDIRLAEQLESYGVRLFNSAKSIELCDDKSRSYTALMNSGIKMPKTILVPMSYFPVDWEAEACLTNIKDALSFPVVLKESFGSFGQQVYLVSSYKNLMSKMKEIGNKAMIIQEYISSSHGLDVRLHVVGDKVVTCMYRYSENGDFRANVTNGAKMKPYEPTKEQSQLAVTACKALGLDWGGVDIIFDSDESPILCEVNSNAHFKNIYDCTGINAADYTIEYIRKQIYGR